MKYFLIIFFTFLQWGIQAQPIATMPLGTGIKIQWVDNLSGDFSFSKKWDYPEGVYKNEFGQLSCDGICPEEVYGMMDSTGRIYTDSLEAFYKIVDTTHQFRSIKATAWCYEYAGTDYIECYKDVNGTLQCKTLMNTGTHCSLQLEFGEADKFTHLNKYCYPSVFLNSIFFDESSKYKNQVIYPCTSGWIKIDKKSWDKGILKAIFNFKFKNTTDKFKPIFWKGKMFFKNIHWGSWAG